MRNKFAGKCLRCGVHVPSGEGYPQIRTSKWRGWQVRCRKCVGQGNNPLATHPDRARLAEHREGGE